MLGVGLRQGNMAAGALSRDREKPPHAHARPLPSLRLRGGTARKPLLSTTMNYTSQHPPRARSEERSGGACVVGEAGWAGPEAECSRRAEEMSCGGRGASLLGWVGRAWPGPLPAWVPQPPRALLSPIPRRGERRRRALSVVLRARLNITSVLFK